MIRPLQALVSAVSLTGCNLMPQFPPVDPDFVPVIEHRNGIALYMHPAEAPRPPLVLVHGTPGDWRAFEWYLANDELNRQLRVMAPDRPGFGATTVPLTVSLAEQARLMLAALPGDGPLLVGGHSLGGSVALEMALQAPERVCGVLLIAASLDPALEQPRWFNRAAQWVRPALPAMLRDSNDEVMALAAELEGMLGRVDRLRPPVVLIQGQADRLVDPRSSRVLKARLSASRLVVHEPEHAGHFQVWNEPEWVAARMLELAALSEECLNRSPQSAAVR